MGEGNEGEGKRNEGGTEHNTVGYLQAYVHTLYVCNHITYHMCVRMESSILQHTTEAGETSTPHNPHTSLPHSHTHRVVDHCVCHA